MGKKSAQSQSNKSLKTFYLYAVIVFFLICFSIIIRGILLYQQNIFDPAHHFTLAVIQKGTVKEIIGFNPQIPGIAVLKVADKKVTYQTLAKTYGIPSDGYIRLDDSQPLPSDVTALLWSSIMHTATLDTNLTIFDSTRLFLTSKNVATNNEVTTALLLQSQSVRNTTEITQALTDPEIASESISIQIINATTVLGIGQRLARTLTNMGANVVDVSSAQNVQEETTLAYYDEPSYTLHYLQNFLHVAPSKLTKQPIADIIITIGTDKRNTATF